MFKVLHKEINSFLGSYVAYMAIGVFLLMTSLFVWFFPQTNVLDYGIADLSPLFSIAPYVFLFLVPSITMKSFAEEQKTGTIELLLTRPIGDASLIIGKFLAGLLLVVFSILPTLTYYYSIYQLGETTGNIDTAAVIGSYIGLILLASSFTAIGIFASALTDNQILSFLLAILISYFMYDGISEMVSIDLWSNTSEVFERFGMAYHYNALSRGLVDMRNVIYFLSVTVILLALTNYKLNSRKW